MKQTSDEERDFLLWRFFHKDLTPQELMLVQEQLASNIDWQNAFVQIQRDEQQFSLLETEMPSLRFSKNVLEAIATKTIAQPTKSYVNTKLIKAIGFGFIALVTVFLIVAISQVKWTSGSGQAHELTSVKLPSVHINWGFASSNSWLYGCFAIVMVCGFVLVDRLLASKRMGKIKAQH